MKITEIVVYQVDLPFTETYYMSGGRSYTTFDSTIISVSTDEGMVGWGESCPFGSWYLPAYAPGVRAGIAELAPHVLGENPSHLDKVNYVMDKSLPGHLYAKSAIDIACWDILGKMTGLSVSELLGGRFGGATDLVSSISTDTPEAMAANVARLRAKGYRKHSFKLGGDARMDISRIHTIMAEARPEEEFYADANGGLTPSNALRVVRGVKDVDLIFEQPCRTYEQCMAVQRRTDHPVMLDEVVEDMAILVRIVNDTSAEAINLKISRVGGLSKARKMRDVCVAAGLIMTMQDTGGSEIARAAIAHLAQSTPEPIRHSLWDPTELTATATADDASEIIDGRLVAPEAPGLGIEPRINALGEPVAVYRA